ncbi:histidine kinase [Ornithinibacillus massiliensis]|uniref:histidine kinase n=1 Tax=Ornithinibacillus massiliensis TaxID=1944633 RepID=A0ABS5MFS8_9BACI|nr:ATP-binding protein [Ornithinibacillus massiliensis]MBS3680747.1 histidine kinase [Ornithinibacillus massiliensis]
MRQKASIMIASAIVIVTVMLLFMNVNGKSTQQFENGKLDLSDWDGHGIIQLDGEWEFYKDVFLNPIDSLSSDPEFIKVPSIWDDYFNNLDDRINVGSYRLVVTVPEEDEYAISVQSIRHASQIYINGELVGGLGTPASNRGQYEYREGKYIVRGKSENHQLDIVVHVANSSVIKNGGIVKSILFGKVDPVYANSAKGKFFDGVVVAGYLLLGIIFLFQFLLNKNARNELYFSIFCFLQGIYVSTQNEKLLYLFYPDIPMKVLLSIQLSFISLSVLFFFLFIRHTFHFNTSPRLVKWMKWILLIQTIYFGIPKSTNYLKELSFIVQCTYIAVLSIVFIYIIVMIIKAFRQKVEGSEYLLVATTCFSAYGATLALELLFQIKVDQIPVFLFLMMTMTFSFFIGYRRKLSYEKIDNLSKELLVLGQFKDQFLAKTTEELKKPIFQITQDTNALIEGNNGPLKKDQYDLVYRMHYASKRLRKLVDDFNILRGEYEHLNLDVKPIRLDVINEIVEEQKYFLGVQNRIIIKNQLAHDLPYVLADENGLRQIVFQLLQNAITYTEEGTITISAIYKADKVFVSIADTGIGIEEQYQEQIFESFFQIAQPNRMQQQNLGLGLSITKKIVELMDGEISVHSTPDKGSCFTFSLPVYQAQEVAASVTYESTEEDRYPIKQYQQQQSKIILLLDHDHQHLRYMMKVLVKNGYSVIGCTNSSDAYTFFKQEAIDLAIIDGVAQDGVGQKLTKQIRDEYALAELPILMLSVTGQNMPYYIQLGANDVIAKPVEMREFISRVQSLLLIKDSFRESIQSELKYYRGQIAPHFLYNTLNTIIALSYENPEKSREALEHLSIYFRSKLDSQIHQELIPLANEIEFVQSYVAIEKLRFGDRLQVIYDIDEEIDMMIPTMTIQPLVENAITHGISKQNLGGTLTFTVKREDGIVLIIVEDDGIGIPEEIQAELLYGSSNRLGFKNPYEKMKLIKNTTFELISSEGKGTKIIIRIKL